MLPTLSMRLMVGITFVIPVLALGLHLGTFVSVPMFSEAPPLDTALGFSLSASR
jgi:hypothetical protein